MIKSKDIRLKDKEQDLLDILKYQKKDIDEIGEKTKDLLDNTNAPVVTSEIVLRSLGVEPDNILPDHDKKLLIRKKLELRSWDEILAEAKDNIDEPAAFEDLLSNEEILAVEKKLGAYNSDFYEIHKLDKTEWAICGIAGILAALVDVLLIQMPKHPGYLGGKASTGGPLSNWIREKVNSSLSPEQINKLERNNWVPYDAANSKNLKIPIDGLYSKTHRFHSLGHDPVLGFIFGVKDILQGTFTAIDTNGVLITQKVTDIKDTSILGMTLFQAIGRMLGHLNSDTTKMSLPVPGMPLLQFLNFGDIGKYNRTIGKVSREMYRQGYNFQYFLSMSISPLLIEIIVRLCYFFKRNNDGYDFKESIPFNLLGNQKQPKLQTMLFSAHLIATSANAGKVIITKNPLSINYSQWIAFFRYAIPQLRWLIYEKENKRYDFVQKEIDTEWAFIDNRLEETWNMVSEKIVLS